MIYFGQVSEVLIDHLFKVLENSKQTGHIITEETCTQGGIQTRNIVDKINPELFSNELKHHIEEYMYQHYDNNIQYKCCVDHVHIIDYEAGGSQRIHDHRITEDHSFIIFMNNSDGKTRIFLDEPCDVESEYGKLIIFNAAHLHEGLPCSNKRVIAVGAIRFIHKTWNGLNNYIAV